MKIGVIADDFTGATDIASFLVLNGLSTVQLCEVSEDLPCPDVDAVVISHKSRSCDTKEAIDQVLRSLAWLEKNNCEQVYFKYCSTFDSSEKGNIGPVTDILMEKLGVDFTIFQPALPVNGRTVYKGYLFVGDVLLSESGMRHHPITPMTDSYIPRLVQMQSNGKCAVISSDVLDKGDDAIKQYIEDLKKQGYKYAAVDALSEEHLITQGRVFKDYKLVTGGSGLAIGLARAKTLDTSKSTQAQEKGYPQGKKAVVFSGSCSVMTNKQVAVYKDVAAAQLIDIKALFDDENYASYLDSIVKFVLDHVDDKLAPLVYATADSNTLSEIQNTYGAKESSTKVEEFFYKLAQKLQKEGIQRFIVAGGETSGIVTQSLGVKGFYIGPAIAPGVPWVRSINNDISLTLKSGNFGDERFFIKAQEDFLV